jgi:hypothetical protein
LLYPLVSLTEIWQILEIEIDWLKFDEILG